MTYFGNKSTMALAQNFKESLVKDIEAAIAAKLPTFVRCTDGKYYEDLVYQDFPSRCDWFVCFSPVEPAEIVLRESAWAGGFNPKDILKHRGFGDCVARVTEGRKEKHKRFFGPIEGATTREQALECHDAISWFLVFKKGVALPAPNKYDSCAEVWPVFPNREGIYFGEKV